MEAAKDEECSVCVAVNVRPLVESEREQGCRSSLGVAPGIPQVAIGQHEFMYDHVFGGGNGAQPESLYARCVSPLIGSLFNGYNATVFAYGQTGSGKTYTMGSEYKPGGKAHGVIPESINAIFKRIEAMPESSCTVRVSFVEIHKEEIKDLLLTNPSIHTVVSIRENPGSGVCLYGAVEKEVTTKEEMASILEQGTLCRSTGSTNMNSRSSRSHAVFTITLEQRRQMAIASSSPTGGNEDDDEDDDEGNTGEDAFEDFLCAKMHLVDLAGSERAKRTKAEGARLKEGIHINRGLLALGNVINAIVDNHKHVPYRDSKLTRLLQDSLGGNSRTVMIACVSPADINYEESLNTLRYADRARHIRNKPTVNRDPVAAQVAALQQQVSHLRSENTALKKALAAEGGSVSFEQPEADQQWQLLDQMRHETSALELDNARLKVQMESMAEEVNEMSNKYINTKAELDVMRIEHPEQHSGEIPSDGDGSGALLRGYIAKIASLEKELHHVKSFQQLTHKRAMPRFPAKAAPSGMTAAASTPGSSCPEIDGVKDTSLTPNDQHCNETMMMEDEADHGEMDADAEHLQEPGDEDEMFYAEMAAHAFEQEKMKQDIVALQRVLEQKEKKMGELQRNTNQVPALKQHYDRVLSELESERDQLQRDKVDMLHKLQQLSSASEDERKRLEAQYKERIAHYDEKLKEVRRKERDFAIMQKLKHRTDEMCSRLNGDIARIRSQKVSLQKNMEASAKQFQQWRVQREKEILQLRRQNRRNAVQIQHLEAMQVKQNCVLQRKIADATAARKKLKDLHTLGQASVARERAAKSEAAAPVIGPDGAEVRPNSGAPILRTEHQRREWLEAELDSCNQSFEYRRVLEGELAQRGEAYRQLREVMKKLMISDNLVPSSPLLAPGGGDSPMAQGMLKPGETREKLLEHKAFLEKELLEHNNQIEELQRAWELAKADDEGRGAGAADVKRWAGIRHVTEAKELLKALFRTACDHKSTANDTAMEAVKIQEELDLMRVKLDAAKKESDAHRKRAAAISATAASAMASPFATTSHGRESAYDEEVDELLQQLKVAAASPGEVRDSKTITVKVPAAVAKALEFISPSKAQQLMARTPSSAGPRVDEPEQCANDDNGAITFDDMDLDDGLPTPTMSPAGMRQQVHAYSSGERPSKGGRYTHSPTGGIESDDDVVEEDDVELDDSEDDDDDWDPSNPTPAKNSSLYVVNRVRRATASRDSSVEPESAKPLPARPTASSIAKMRSSCSSVRGSLFGSSEVERAVLAGINKDKELQGMDRADKLTVKSLKDFLAGKVVQGKQWRAGSKTKDQLIQSCCSFMGLHHPEPLSRMSSLDSSASKSHLRQSLGLPRTSPKQAGTPHHRPPPSPGSTPSPMNCSIKDYRAAIMSPGDQPLIRASTSGRSTPNGGSGNKLRASYDGRRLAKGSGATKGSFDRSPAAPDRQRSPLLQMAANKQSGVFGNRSYSSESPIHRPVMNIPDTPVSDFSMGERPQGRSSALTPLSRLYIQKAQEARERTALLRQSVRKSTTQAPVVGEPIDEDGRASKCEVPAFSLHAPSDCDPSPVEMDVDSMDCDSPMGALALASPQFSAMAEGGVRTSLGRQVDLAGSERAKRTKAEGARLKEGIHINRGLLALGNVINAIVDNHKHVPYRDSKLTRLLQDSLGGNSRTVMIACVSPADINYEESLNTLRYADRARHIRNKPTVNRDPVAAQVAALQQQVSHLRSENTALKKALAAEGGSVSFEQPEADQQWQLLDQMRHETSALELDDARLKVQMESMAEEVNEMSNKYINTKAELDVMRIEHPEQHSGEIPSDGDGSGALLRGYIAKIASLEKELHHVKSFQQLTHKRAMPRFPAKAAPSGMTAAASTPGSSCPEIDGVKDTSLTPNDQHCNETMMMEDEADHGEMDADAEHLQEPGDEDEMFYAEMAAHAFEQEKMKQDIVALQRVLEQKEKKMGELQRNTNQVPALKQHYDRVLSELESERDQLQRDKVDMLHKLQQLSSASEDERKRLEAQYKERIAHYDEKLKEVRRKERDFAIMQKLKHRTDEMCSRLNGDIARIRSQKVSLQKNMEASAKQFQQWRVQRKKEILQLRRQNRRNAVQIQHLEAMQVKQNCVLQRKIADATAARKKLKDLHTLGQASVARERAAKSEAAAPVIGPDGAEVRPNSGAPILRTEHQRREWLEAELDSCNQSFEYRRVLEGELAQRGEAYRQLREVMKKLMISDNLVPSSPLLAPGGGDSPMAQGMLKPGETREKLLEHKAFLEKELLEHNNQIEELQRAWELAKADDEGRGAGAADVKRWAGIRHVTEAKELLKALFRTACDHKSTANDTAMEAVKIQEELDLMRVKLDAAKKESDAHRKRAAAISATAASAMASPFATTSHGRESAYDEEVDELLQQLKVAAASPGEVRDSKTITGESPSSCR
eukprot:gene8275-1544_t